MVSVIVAGGIAPVQGGDWPQYLGPERTSVAVEKGLVRSFPDGGPKILWDAELEPGFGGCAVVGDEVFVVDRVAREKDMLLCLDFATGREKWRFEHASEGEPSFPGSRNVPSVDDGSVYFIGSFGDVFCIDRKTRKPRWQVKMAERYPDAETPKWGYAQNALVVGDIVIVTPFGDRTGVAGWDRRTGKEVWKSGPVGDSHSSPTVLEFGGEPHVVLVSVVDRDEELGHVTGYRPTDGKMLWQTDAYYNRIPIPIATRIDEDRLFVTGGYDCGSMMLSIKNGDDGSYDVGKLWSIDKGSQVHPPLLLADHLYFLANENSNHRGSSKRKSGGLSCWTLDGKELWNTGAEPFIGRGGWVFADGMLIIQDGENGVLRLVDPDPSGFRLLAEANVFGSDLEKRFDLKFWSPPALSNGRLLMRGQGRLLCVDLRK
jgi:outer membrane protein assembly factor BamB